MKVFTEWPSLVPHIKRAGHTPVLVPPHEGKADILCTVSLKGLECPPSRMNCDGCPHAERHPCP
jgi:hypothetical protein